MICCAHCGIQPADLVTEHGTRSTGKPYAMIGPRNARYSNRNT